MSHYLPIHVDASSVQWIIHALTQELCRQDREKVKLECERDLAISQSDTAIHRAEAAQSRVEELEAERVFSPILSRWRSHLSDGTWFECADEQTSERLKELEADQNRLDFLMDHRDLSLCSTSIGWCVCGKDTNFSTDYCASMRLAVDEAMRKKREGK